jgi:23S rRNA (cytosine1962-C5)-methyltransferase
MKELRLRDSLATSLASGHPWVYRDHVGSFQAPSGTWVKVSSASFSAVGLWDSESQIAVRLFSTEGPVTDEWIFDRVREAYGARSKLRRDGVTGYRLIFGEADQLPGIVVDMYGPYAVLLTYSKSLGVLSQKVAEAVLEVTGCRGVARRVKQDEKVQLLPLAGEPVAESVTVEEYGMRLVARLSRGQKTGLFFDHRENRAYVRARSEGARVLNLYSYTGGFSVAAALGGARAVTSVDIAAPAIEDARLNFEENQLGDFPHEGVAEDVIVYLERAAKARRRFNLIVCDPPSFARNKTQVRGAEKAYRKVMSAALELVEPGGLFCAASCTSQVGPAAFRQAINDAARKARVRYQVVHDVGQPADHPVAIGHEEGRYLKFVVGRILPRC